MSYNYPAAWKVLVMKHLVRDKLSKIVIQISVTKLVERSFYLSEFELIDNARVLHVFAMQKVENAIILKTVMVIDYITFEICSV